VKKRGRKIVVEGNTYQWQARGDAGAIIWDSQDKKYLVDCFNLTGLRPDIFERGANRGNSDGMIIPSQIAGWIKEHLCGGPSRTPAEIADLSYQQR
jgi:hypothetical protein